MPVENVCKECGKKFLADAELELCSECRTVKANRQPTETCTRCGHTWIPRSVEKAAYCPKCFSRHWSVPKAPNEKVFWVLCQKCGRWKLSKNRYCMVCMTSSSEHSHYIGVTKSQFVSIMKYMDNYQGANPKVLTLKQALKGMEPAKEIKGQYEEVKEQEPQGLLPTIELTVEDGKPAEQSMTGSEKPIIEAEQGPDPFEGLLERPSEQPMTGDEPINGNADGEELTMEEALRVLTGLEWQ